MPKLIRNWEELAQVPPNDKFKIVVDLECGCGWIRPIVETEETKNDKYFKTHKYLSTHTFYGKTYEYSTEVLQKFGFDIELENWDKENGKGEE